MRTFAQFFESNSLTLLPPDNSGSLSGFLDTLVGSSIKNILDKNSYINLYMGNKYGFGSMGSDDKAVQKFTNALVGFINRDVLKHRPTERAYETEEFRKAHNYDEYTAITKERNAVFREIMGKTGDERDALYKKKSEVEDRLHNTQFAKAMRDKNNEYDQAVDDYHNSPLTKKYLSDDGSETYKNLELAYKNLLASRSSSTEEDNTSYLDV